MNTYATCPCCSNKLIHHISNHRDYWFCRRCWQEMPLINKQITQEAREITERQETISNSISNLLPLKTTVSSIA